MDEMSNRKAGSETLVDASPGLDRERPRPVLVVRLGRGRTGGSTCLDWIVQRARRQGRRALIGDGDKRNPTLSGLYPPGTPDGATQPESDETADVKDWITSELGRMATEGASLVLDLGGGDRVLAEYGRDLAIPSFCEKRGFDPLALYFTGPDEDDFNHVLALYRSGHFAAKRVAVVLNAALVRAGLTPLLAFAPIRERPELAEMGKNGVRFLLMPVLPCMEHVRRSGLGFYDAADNKPGADGKPLDPVRQFMVESWLERVESAFSEAGVAEWLP